MISVAAKDRVADAAHALVGVRYRHQGRTQEGGIDCVGVLVLSARAAGIELDDVTNYPIHGDPIRLKELLDAQLDPISIHAVGVGDVVTIARRPGRPAVHVAIRTRLGIVHTTEAWRTVVEHPIDAEYASRIVAGYAFREP